jgi:hypothetical protein
VVSLGVITSVLIFKRSIWTDVDRKKDNGCEAKKASANMPYMIMREISIRAYSIPEAVTRTSSGYRSKMHIYMIDSYIFARKIPPNRQLATTGYSFLI